MATGRTAVASRMNDGIVHFTRLLFALAVCLPLTTMATLAAEVGLAGVVGGKALLVVDGRPARAFAVGQAEGEVRLVAVQDDRVVVEIGGKRRALGVGQYAVGTAAANAGQSAILTADGAGHFVTTGTVNGSSVRFLVDTGATMVSLGAADARRIGIDLSRGQQARSQTANGIAQVTKVKLDSVRIGEITLYNVDALVHQGDLPVALLGMSFLNRMEMQNSGSTMTLKKRF